MAQAAALAGEPTVEVKGEENMPLLSRCPSTHGPNCWDESSKQIVLHMLSQVKEGLVTDTICSSRCLQWEGARICDQLFGDGLLYTVPVVSPSFSTPRLQPGGGGARLSLSFVDNLEESLTLGILSLWVSYGLPYFALLRTYKCRDWGVFVVEKMQRSVVLDTVLK